MKLNRFHKVVLVALLATQHFPAVAQTTNALAPAGFAKFIADRNIFDPDRYPIVAGAPPRPRPTSTVSSKPVPPPDTFALVGIIGYGEGRLAGAYAFFNGSSDQYQRTVKLNGSIAIFKVADIAADSVTLMSGTNKMILGVGEELKSDGNGHWSFSNGTTGRYNTASSYNNGNGYGRSGFNNGGGRRRGNNSYGNYNAGNAGGNAGNFTRGRNNYAPSAATDNSQASDMGDTAPGDFPPTVTTSDGTFIAVPVMISPDNSAAPDDTTPPDNNN
jgi:hypothetical protein